MSLVEHWFRHFSIWREPNDPGDFSVCDSSVWVDGGSLFTAVLSGSFGGVTFFVVLRCVTLYLVVLRYVLRITKYLKPPKLPDKTTLK